METKNRSRSDLYNSLTYTSYWHTHIKGEPEARGFVLSPKAGDRLAEMCRKKWNEEKAYLQVRPYIDSALYNGHIESGADSTLLVAQRSTSRYLYFDTDGLLHGWSNEKTGQVRSPYPDFDKSHFTPCAFQGIHVLSHTLLPLLDAIPEPRFSITDFYVDNARVGQDASYDKLTMEVETNGSIRPEEAMALGAKILIEHLNIVTNLSEIADITGIMNAKQEDSKLKKLETSIDDLDFSVRAYNCLKRANINTLGDLTEKSELEMMKIRNLGKKSLKEVMDKIKDMGLKFREDD